MSVLKDCFTVNLINAMYSVWIITLSLVLITGTSVSRVQMLAAVASVKAA